MKRKAEELLEEPPKKRTKENEAPRLKYRLEHNLLKIVTPGGIRSYFNQTFAY
jgi:hypothetical protein